MIRSRFDVTDGQDWLGRVVKFLAIAAAIVALYGFISQGTNAVALAQASKIRIDTLEARAPRTDAALSAVSYMTCVNFAETHLPVQVPGYCNSVVRFK